MFHGDAAGLDDVDDVDDYDDDESDGIRFHGIKKNYKRVPNHCHYTGKHRAAAHIICNSRENTPKQILLFPTIVQTMTTIECLGENAETNIALPVLKEKHENGKTIK